MKKSSFLRYFCSHIKDAKHPFQWTLLFVFVVVIAVGLKSFLPPKPHSWGGAGAAAPAGVVVERQGRREEEPGRPLWRGQHFGAGCFCLRGDLSGWGDGAVAAKCIGLPWPKPVSERWRASIVLPAPVPPTLPSAYRTLRTQEFSTQNCLRSSWEEQT